MNHLPCANRTGTYALRYRRWRSHWYNCFSSQSVVVRFLGHSLSLPNKQAPLVFLVFTVLYVYVIPGVVPIALQYVEETIYR